ncbi:MAG: hypothetical protein JXR45_15865 [Deltaproteobacteria bacterium]|nr:hypothetical protein [Deltaproteobacteria bacterium]
MKLRRWAYLLVLLLFVGCTQSVTVQHAPPSQVELHTVSRIDSLDRFRSFAPVSEGKLTAIKFIIIDFQLSAKRKILFMDGRFYMYHDEWYWFQRLNGLFALGDAPWAGSPGCDTPRSCVDWVRAQPSAPNGLSFVDDRLYANRFYELALQKKRPLGLGALVLLPNTGSSPAEDGRFGFRLEYMDTPSAADILVYFEELSRALESRQAKRLVWITRSPYQEKLASQMISENRLSAAQVLSYADLAEEGEAEIYHGGVSVGRLTWVDGDNDASAFSDRTQILVMTSVPDELPPAAGLITAVPMTPLSHVNLLAKNRGIPSVYVGGVAENAYVKQLADGYAPVLLDAREKEVRLRVLTEAEYKRFSSDVVEITFNPVADYAHSPYTFTLDEARQFTRADKNALIGGKAAGFEVLYAASKAHIPSEVLFVTTRAYTEHIASLQPKLDAILTHPAFLNSMKVRYFVLEGQQAFETRFHSREDEQFIERLKQSAPRLYQMGNDGGIKGNIRRLPIPAEALREITKSLRQIFGSYPNNQGLRFRSSSTVEDIDGFNGAGLYVSSTGFLSDSMATIKGTPPRTIAWALKRTWASYWNFEAFEERQLAGIDHTTGAMGVVVHARFDDEWELANGVVTFRGWTGRYSRQNGVYAQMDVNAQAGALSVTNPPPQRNALPETLRVILQQDGSHTIERVRSSSVDGVRGDVLNEQDIEALLLLCRRVFEQWEQNAAAIRSAETAPRFVTLDLEFRKMAAPWPGNGTQKDEQAARIILKQVRSLEPAPRIPGIFHMNFSAPGDALRVATSVSRRVCAQNEHQLSLLEITLATGEPMSNHYRLVSDVSVVVENQLEVLTPGEYMPFVDDGTFTLMPAATARLGVERFVFDEMACTTVVLAQTREALILSSASTGKVIGRVK